MRDDRDTTTPPLRLFSPAKVNLMLCVHRKRSDGFHELTSLMAPVDLGDWLEVGPTEESRDRLLCDRPEVPTGPENLVLRAAEAFRERTGESRHFQFKLEKRIPMGAGLGGGSGNAATALTAVNRICGSPLATADLEKLAARVGSDCPFFVQAAPAVVRGRGERLEPVDPATAARLRELRLLVFHPGFSVATAWAYERLAANPDAYAGEDEARDKLASFADGGTLNAGYFNSFEKPVGGKFLAIPALLKILRDAGVTCGMSGSGSACFAVWEGAASGELARCTELIRDAWGAEAFCVETVIGAQNTSGSGRLSGKF